MKNTQTLKYNKEYEKALKKGKYYKGKKIIIVIAENKKNQKEIGLAVSVKKGKAHLRNKAKRLIRENYYKQEEKIKNGKTIVFLIKKETDLKNLTYEDVKQDMQNIFKKAEITKKEEKE